MIRGQNTRQSSIANRWMYDALQHELTYNIVQAPILPFQIMIETLGWATSSPLPDGTNGSAYSEAVVATGGTGSYTYAVTAGAAPTGLTVNSDGTITGTPTVNGLFTFTVTATDTGGNTGSKEFTITINAAAGTTALKSTIHFGLSFGF